MPEDHDTGPAARHPTRVERASDRELVVTRAFDAPVHIVFEAWSRAEIFRQWWVPRSVGLTLLSCDMDVRTGGKYRLVFSHPMSDEPVAFFGTYTDVRPNERIVWTNDETDQGAVTTVTFDEEAGRTLVTFRELYTTKAALDDALAGSAEALPHQFAQLDEMLATWPD